MTALDDPLGQLEDSPRAYVLLDQRILFISLAKNACTTIKWLLAELAGEDLAGFRPGLRNFVNRAESIHDRPAWQHAPRLSEITVAQRNEIRPENGWFVFAVTRDPRARMFSAWQNKFLMRGPAHRRHLDAPWYPNRFTAEGIRSDFGAFVAAMRDDPGHRILEDTHFRSQTRLLRSDVVPYSRTYDIRELSQLVGDLEAHVRNQGYDGPELSLGRFNETPLRANADLFTPAVRTDVERIYADDFAELGDRWSFAAIEDAPAWAPETLALLPLIADLGERVGDLRQIALERTRDSRELKAEVATQRTKLVRSGRRARRLRAQLAAARARESRRVPVRLRRAVRRLVRR